MKTISKRTYRAANYSRPAFVHSLLIALFALVFNTSQAQDYGLYWKYKDYDDAIAVSVPGLVAKLGSLFVSKEDGRDVLRKTRNIRVLVFEGKNPITAKDFKRFNRKAKRRHLDELVTVRDGKTRVQIYGKMRRNSIRKVVVFFSSPDDGAGIVSLRGKYKIDDINKAIKRANKKSRETEKQIVPPAVKIPVSRV